MKKGLVQLLCLSIAATLVGIVMMILGIIQDDMHTILLGIIVITNVTVLILIYFVCVTVQLVNFSLHIEVDKLQKQITEMKQWKNKDGKH